MTEYLEEGASINKKDYSEELKQLREELKRKRRGKLSRGVLLLQDNAPPHTAQLSVTTASQCGFELLLLHSKKLRKVFGPQYLLVIAKPPGQKVPETKRQVFRIHDQTDESTYIKHKH